jgi:hypothetical protein
MFGIGLYVYTMCTHNDSTHTQERGLYFSSLVFFKKAGALSMLALKVIISESREKWC